MANSMRSDKRCRKGSSRSQASQSNRRGNNEPRLRSRHHRIMINHLRNGLVIFVGIGLFGCASIAPKVSGPQLQLVGLWREDSDDYNAVVLRKADGEYLGKRMQNLQVAKPASFISERGKWWLNSQYYFVKVVESSTNRGAIDHRENRKSIKFEVQNISPIRFIYLSPDGAVVTERKIGETSDSAFNEATVSLPGITPEK